MDHSEEFEKWMQNKPPIIRQLVAAYPPGRYRMKENAPYAISCPGTLVTLAGYRETGEVIVIVDADDLLPEAIAHQKMLLNRRGGDYSEVAGRPQTVYVDPIYLELMKKEI